MTNHFEPTTGETSPDKNEFRFSFAICAGWVPYYTINGVYIGHKAGDEYRLPNGTTVSSYCEMEFCCACDIDNDYKMKIYGIGW